MKTILFLLLITVACAAQESKRGISIDRLPMNFLDSLRNGGMEFGRVSKSVVSNPGATTATVKNHPAPTLTATVTDTSDAITNWKSHATSTAKTNPSGVISGFTQMRRDWMPDIQFQVKTSSLQNKVDSCLMWIGWFSASPDGSPNPNIALTAFRYMRGWGTSAVWTCVSQNSNAAKDTTVTSVAVAPNTVYNFRIQCTATSCVFYINNVVVATHSTNLPTSSTLLGYGIRVVNLLGVFVKDIKWSRIYFTHN